VYTVGVIGAGADGATTNVLGSTAALNGGFGSGNTSFSTHVIAISTSMIAVKRRIIAPAAKQVPLYHGLSMARYLQTLGLVDRKDAMTAMVAKKLFELAEAGVREPVRLKALTVQAFNLTPPRE
jgi:hypothetical protein